MSASASNDLFQMAISWLVWAETSSRSCKRAPEMAASARCGLPGTLVEVMAEPFVIGTQEVSIGVSIGISLAPADGLTASELMHKADLALYRVKAEGRNGFLFFEEEMGKQALSRNRLVSELRMALTRSEFELHYQPMFDAKTLRVAGMEALVRWRHPTAGLLYPDHFIGVAEQAGLMQPLGRSDPAESVLGRPGMARKHQGRRQSVCRPISRQHTF